MNAVFAASNIRLGITALVLCRAGLPPACHGVVVMRAGIDDLALGAVRQVDVRAFVSETKLQNGHSRNLQPVPQGVDLRSDVAQVFSKERQAAQRLAELQEEVVARPIHPATVHSRGIRRGNFPELVESPEVIEADVVTVLRRPAQPLNPPFVAARLHHIPAVERISPALSGLAEKIGRHACHDFRLKILVQPEQFAVRPNVGAVVVHEDCDVAHHTDRALGAVTPQGPPLFVESELQRASDLDVGRQFLTSLVQRSRLSVGQIPRPMIPAFKLLPGTQGIE